ncbi:pentapeptide repeat-containing protein [Campylobacter jejuni]|uniref:pentapeptide repeat-containing protein n=1 Tax=Campylobacter jejuni TaxID=197 RepID=UPI000ABD9D2D|nr:pentapeptide repeat-containing protein [Campylobacter jejuni]
MIKEILEKILNTLKKCCEKTHQNDKSESDGKETADIDELSKVLSIDKQNIFTPSHKETNEIIEKIKGKEDFRQSDGLFSDDEKWYLVCKATLDLSSLCDNMNNIQYNAITQCNIIFSECNISLNDKQSENNRIVKTKLYFYNCTFEKTLNLKNIIFEKTLTFNQCKFKRKIRMYSNIFSSHLVFRDCHDNQDKKITSLDLQENKFEGYLFIKNCAIEKINLWKNKFKNRCYFMDCEFGYKQDKDNQVKLNFSNTHFEDNAYFNNSEFYNYADFHECEFDDIACFYGVKFHKIPNFSQVVLKGNFNALNITSNFVFDDLKKQIKQEYENFNKDIKEKENKKPLDKFANDFRDSFRIFKSALIKDNNLLDASNFHKYELYCKEIELKNKKGKTFKDVVDRWQLLFYRKLCDHHTNLILNLKWFIVIVGFFTSILFGLRYGDGNLMQFFNKDSDLLKMLKNILNIKALNDSNATYLILLYSFIGLFFVRTFFIFYYLVIFILMLAISPYNLFSMINFAIRHETNSFLENIIIIIYTLSIVLIIFSLQKTARKNSIVPS